MDKLVTGLQNELFMDYGTITLFFDKLGVSYHAYTCYSTDGKNTPLKAIHLYNPDRTIFFDEDGFMSNIF